MKRLLDYDPVTKAQLDWYDYADGSVVIDHRQDVSDALDTVKHLQQRHQDGHTDRKSPVRLAAIIPNVIWEDLERRGIANDPVALKRWIDDRDNSAFKVYPGSLAK